ncbi:hypothetical protein HK101_009710 [Irineochytrium annulatum]|nr:hypothetical protein HK101_009710 [Irineochytrium annulatum]
MPETSPSGREDDDDPFGSQPVVFRPIEPARVTADERGNEEEAEAGVAVASDSPEVAHDEEAGDDDEDDRASGSDADAHPYPSPTISPTSLAADDYPPSDDSYSVASDPDSDASAIDQENVPAQSLTVTPGDSPTASASRSSSAAANLLLGSRHRRDTSMFRHVCDAEELTQDALDACDELDRILAAPVELDEAQQRARARRAIIDRELAKGAALAPLRIKTEGVGEDKWRQPVSDARRARLRCVDVPVSFKITTRDYVIERQIAGLIGMWEEGERRKEERLAAQAKSEEEGESFGEPSFVAGSDYTGRSLLRRASTVASDYTGRLSRRSSGLGSGYASSPLPQFAEMTR